jgi:hypothetical protein
MSEELLHMLGSAYDGIEVQNVLAAHAHVGPEDALPAPVSPSWPCIPILHVHPS